MKVAIQIDPLVQLNLKRDTTLALAFEAMLRRYEVSIFHPQDLYYEGGKVYANCRVLSLSLGDDGFVPTEGATYRQDLSHVDVILIRQDPPFDMQYICNTYLLDIVADKTLVLNNPTGIRNSVEKLLPLEFQELIPPTLITQDWPKVESFCREHEEVIIKPLFEFGGHGVFHVNAAEGQLKGLFQLLKRTYPGLPLIIQPFIPEVITGDKRLILIDGELVGGFSRIPPQGEVRSNMLMGGTVSTCEINERDRLICETISPILRARGLFFVGIDVIGEYLIEINVTSPTGIVPLKELTGIDAAVIYWDKIGEIIGGKAQYGRQYYNSRVSGDRSSTH